MMQSTAVFQTSHYIARAKERLGLNRKAAIVAMEHAYERGAACTRFSSAERRYIEDRMAQGTDVLVYQGSCFLFMNGNCLTVYKLPAWFGKRTYTETGMPVRNARKYQKFRTDDLYAR